MKTITEFDGFFLKRVVDKFSALTAENKTPEEILAAIGEEFKTEGDKLKHLISAVEFAKSKIQGLKRVLVSTFAEGEKIPTGFSEKEGHYFSLEHFPQPPKPAGKTRDGGRNDRGSKRGDKKGGKRGKPRRDGGRDGNNEMRTEGKADGGRPPRKPRAPSTPRPPKVTAAPNGVKISFTDGKPNIQKASGSPSPETPSQSQSSNQAEVAPDSSQS